MNIEKEKRAIEYLKAFQPQSELQNEFLGNLIDECDTLIRTYKNEAKANDYAQIDDSLLTQIEYVVFCAETFIKSMRGEL